MDNLKKSKEFYEKAKIHWTNLLNNSLYKGESKQKLEEIKQLKQKVLLYPKSVN